MNIPLPLPESKKQLSTIVQVRSIAPTAVGKIGVALSSVYWIEYFTHVPGAVTIGKEFNESGLFKPTEYSVDPSIQ